MHKGHMKSGRLTGTGANINVELGFTPQHVRVINQTQLASLEWFDHMTAGHAIREATLGDKTAITAGGISPYAGAAGMASKGFTLGTNLNAAGNVIHYVAWSADA